MYLYSDFDGIVRRLQTRPFVSFTTPCPEGTLTRTFRIIKGHDARNWDGYCPPRHPNDPINDRDVLECVTTYSYKNEIYVRNYWGYP